MARRPTVAIVGCGRTGGSIGLALQRAGYEIGATWSHSRKGRERASTLLDAPVLATPAEATRAGRVVLVAVPDDVIAQVGGDIATAVRKGQRVVHTSGAVPVSALESVREAGGRIGRLHPLQTLPDPQTGADALQGAAVAVSCADEDRAYLYRVVSGWGGRPFLLPEDSAELYHAAAVFASNYVTTALATASRIMTDAGVSGGLDALGPLVRATVDNVLGMGAERALTGPIARGDMGAVRRHVEVLRADDPTVDAYRALARLTAQLAGADPAELEEALR